MSFLSILAFLRSKRLLLGLGLGSVLVYGLLGFLWLPVWLQRQIPSRLNQVLGRSVSVGKVRTNPFTLSISLEDLRIGGKPELLHLRRLDLNVQLTSLLGRGWILKNLDLVEPKGSVELLADGRSSLEDLQARLAPKSGTPSAPLRLSIGHLTVQRARLAFRDLGLPYQTELGPWSFEIRDLKTFGDGQSHYRLEGQTSRQESFQWEGSLSMEPLRSEGRFRVFVQDLSSFKPFLKKQLKGDIHRGRMALEGRLLLAWSPGEHQIQIQEGRIQLQDFGLFGTGEKKPALSLNRLSLKGLKADLLKRKLRLQSLELHGAELRLRRSSDGHLDLLDLLSSPHPNPEPSAPLELQIDRLTWSQVGLQFLDEQAPKPYRLHLPECHGTMAVRVTPEVEIRDLEAAGKELQLVGRDETEASLQGMNFQLRGGGWSSQGISLESLELAKGQLRVLRLPGGRMDWQDFLPSSPSQKPAPPPAFQLARLQASDWRIQIEDRSLNRPMHHVLEDVQFQLESFSPSHDIPISFHSRVNGRGQVKLRGHLNLAREAGSLQIQLKTMELSPFDPLLEGPMDARITRGFLDLEGRGEIRWPRLAFKGRIQLHELECVDGPRSEPFLRAQSLRLEGIEFQSPPVSMKTKLMVWTQPEHRLVLDTDGSSNVGRALRLAPKEGPAAEALASAVPPTPQEALQVEFGEIQVQDGLLSFQDRSLQPIPTLVISRLEGRYADLSTRSETLSSVEFHGLAGGLAPLEIRGTAYPLRQDRDTKLIFSLKGAEMTDFSPYAMKYLGYSLGKGQLGVEAQLKIQERKLDLQSRFRLDQLVLGDRTPSPDETKLPIRLILALLRDRTGRIELELPVDGSLDDPNFRYGKALWTVCLNLLGKLAASPFTLLAKLGGSKEDLSWVAFAPASSRIEETSKLESLRRALEERPELQLELEGCCDPEKDGEALRKKALDLLLSQGKPGQTPSLLSLLEREKRIRELYLKQFSDDKNQSDLSPVDMEKRLLLSQTIPVGRLRELAETRSKALLAWFLEYQLPRERLFLVESEQIECGCRVKLRVK